MSEEKRYYTFLVAPTAKSKARQLSIHRNLVHTAIGALIITLMLAVWGIIGLAKQGSLRLSYMSVKAENEKLKKENETFQNSYSKLKGQITYIEDMSKELARQANMDQAIEVDDQVGTGGPETVSALDKAADQLERGVRDIGDRLRADLLRLASIPTGLPVQGYVTDGFGLRNNPFGGEGREAHEGLDIAVDFGTTVSATADGLVIWAAPHAGYGNIVALYHSNGITTRYGHLSRITVEVGQRVKRGDQIGLAGSTGRSTGPHVHYEVRENDQPVNPARYIGQLKP